MENSIICAMLHRSSVSCWILSNARKSAVNFPRNSHNVIGADILRRWLIDNDKDVAGMRVIADLHGGDLEDVVAKAEFKEIKERVIFEVSVSTASSISPLLTVNSERVGKGAHTL